MANQREGLFQRFQKADKDGQATFCLRELLLRWESEHDESRKARSARLRAFLEALEEAILLDAKRPDLWETFSREIMAVVLPILGEAKKREKEKKHKQNAKKPTQS